MSPSSRLEELGRYLWYNRIRMLVDLLVAFIVVFGGSALVGVLGWPTWALYAILFVAIVAYVYVMPPWDHPP